MNQNRPDKHIGDVEFDDYLSGIDEARKMSVAAQLDGLDLDSPEGVQAAKALLLSEMDFRFKKADEVASREIEAISDILKRHGIDEAQTKSADLYDEKIKANTAFYEYLQGIKHEKAIDVVEKIDSLDLNTRGGIAEAKLLLRSAIGFELTRGSDFGKEQIVGIINLLRRIKGVSDHISGTDEKSIGPQKVIDGQDSKAKDKARSVLSKTLGRDIDASGQKFDVLLKDGIRELPIYKELMVRLQGLTTEKIPHELFKLLQRTAKPIYFIDGVENTDTIPTDGVLLESMRYGVLDCAGRTSVSSIIMQDLGIKHVVGWAPYHAIIIIETNSTTMTYFDANNDVYFSFPKAALE